MKPTRPARTDLPVEDVIVELRSALAGRGAAVLVAPPGAGKTTIVPMRLMAEPWLDGKRIVMLEPRRLAARAAARRSADLFGEPVGTTFGYVTRDERVVGRETRVEVLTEGILVRRLQRDPELAGVGLVIFDEVHERNLFTDLSLALTLDVRRGLHPDLRILAMSATLDGGRFAELLGDDAGPAPVIGSEGRAHPVDVRWVDGAGIRRDRPAEARIADAVIDALRTEGEGDVLVFCPGAAEIRRTVAEIRARLGGLADRRGAERVQVLPLHGSLPVAEQDRALAPSAPGTRRVVVSTDIAESSLTVAGVRIVVDAGLSRLPRFDPRTGRSRLVTEDASRASADQRAGRAGRLGPGVAHRLWPRSEHHLRPLFSPAEITTVDLAAMALELAVWGAAPEDLALIDPPPAPAWNEAVALLERLGAVDGDGRPTAVGKAMADLPLHPRLARIVICGVDSSRGWTGAVLAALLDERDILGGRRDLRSVDLVERVRIFDGVSTDASVDGDRLRFVRRRAAEIARRAGVRRTEIDLDAVGRLIASGYPDRLAGRRSGGGFVLIDGGGGQVRDTDPLAAEPFLAVAEIDGDAAGTIYLAAALDRSEVEDAADDRRQVVEELAWDDTAGDLRRHRIESVGAIVLSRTIERPEPGAETTRALLERLRVEGTGLLGGREAAGRLRARVAFVVTRRPSDGWLDLGEDTVLADLDAWIGPYLTSARGRADLARVDLAEVFRHRLGWERTRELDRVAPTEIELDNGRRLRLTYGGEREPLARVRVQDLFGLEKHPSVLDSTVPIVLELLSPADRPIQITSDLPGFWAGSWAEVRKEMAGRYPRHPWPTEPEAAEPPVRRGRRR